MSLAATRQHQTAFRDFALIDRWQSPHAVTLTMKQGMPVAHGQHSVMAHITLDKASQNLRHFHSVLSRKVLGKPADRYGHRVPMIPVLEGGNGSRLHYHVLIDCPRQHLQHAFPDMIRDVWLSTQWGHREIDIQPDANDGFKFYISRLRDKPSYGDAIDWMNYHNLDRRV